MALEAIAPTLRLATIAVEDASFESNPGIDPLATFRALTQDISAGHIVAGGSTITQQLARLRYLSAEQRATRSLDRKLSESWLAVRLTQNFARPARELSLAQAALLAGLPQAPTVYDPFLHPDAARARTRVVLDLIRRLFRCPSSRRRKSTWPRPRANQVRRSSRSPTPRPWNRADSGRCCQRWALRRSLGWRTSLVWDGAQMLVDGVPIGEFARSGTVGERWGSGPVGWAPTFGHHVLRAVSDVGVESGSVEIEVVPS